MSGGIELTAIDKFYDNGFLAVRSLSLAIAPGELMVLVGPSGCGKTTTLRMIAGLEEVSAGSIRIADREVTRLAPKDRDIAMVFQNYALYPHMTVFDNMAYALRLRRRSKAEIRDIVQRAAKRLDLVAQLHKRPKQLSGGQRQRVALGRAIVRQPAAFLFDEPLSNLDAKLRGSMRFEIKSLQRDLATTAVYVTHDQVEAMTLGDRITVMHQGRIQQVDDPIAVYQRPANRFVAEFIGTPPMNIVDGALDGPTDAPVFVAAGGIRWPVQLADAAAWSETERQACSLGVRPEHLHLADAAGVAGDWPRLAVTVRLIEVLGDHRYLYVALPDQERVWIVKADATGSLAIGDQCEIAIDSRQGHCFAGRDETAPNRSLAASGAVGS